MWCSRPARSVRATVADAPLVSGRIVTAMSRGSTVSLARQNQCPAASAETRLTSR